MTIEQRLARPGFVGGVRVQGMARGSWSRRATGVTKQDGRMGPTMEDRQRIVELLKEVEATAGRARAFVEEHGQSPLSVTEGGIEGILIGSLRQKVAEIWELYGLHE